MKNETIETKKTYDKGLPTEYKKVIDSWEVSLPENAAEIADLCASETYEGYALTRIFRKCLALCRQQTMQSLHTEVDPEKREKKAMLKELQGLSFAELSAQYKKMKEAQG